MIFLSIPIFSKLGCIGTLRLLDLLQDILLIKWKISRDFSFDSNFFQMGLYWYSPAARFVAGHFADQIEDIP